MSRRVFDSSFKKMAVELSYARGSVKEAAAELGVDPGRLTKWRYQQQEPGEKPAGGLTEDQKEIRRLQKKVVGWAMSHTMEAEVITVAAWQMVVRNWPITKSLLFYSDRGVQYACKEFRNQLSGRPVLQSMSRKGNCSR